MTRREAVLAQTWKPAFRHSAGKLGSHFIRAVRNGRLLGWKTERLGVTVPPLEAGTAGEWVDIGPGAMLVGYAPGSQADASGKVFAAVKVDGADTLLFASVQCGQARTLQAGMRLTAILPHDDPQSAVPVFRLEDTAS